MSLTLHTTDDSGRYLPLTLHQLRDWQSRHIVAILLQDVSLWKRLATLSAQLGFVRQAIYCLSKVSRPSMPVLERLRGCRIQHLKALGSPVGLQVIIRDNHDMDARFDRAALYMDLGEPRKVRSSATILGVTRPAQCALGCARLPCAFEGGAHRKCCREERATRNGRADIRRALPHRPPGRLSRSPP